MRAWSSPTVAGACGRKLGLTAHPPSRSAPPYRQRAAVLWAFVWHRRSVNVSLAETLHVSRNRGTFRRSHVSLTRRLFLVVCNFVPLPVLWLRRFFLSKVVLRFIVSLPVLDWARNSVSPIQYISRSVNLHGLQYFYCLRVN